MKEKFSHWIPKLSRKEMERRRFAAAKDLEAGMEQSDVARKYNVNPSSVSRWNRTLQTKGMDGLKRRKAKGKPSKLTKVQQKKLMKILLRGAVVYGYSTDLWTLKRIAQLIKKEFNVTYHPLSLSDILHRLGYSNQKPSRCASERNEKERQEWLNTQWREDRKN